jgi:hypothetical protein
VHTWLVSLLGVGGPNIRSVAPEAGLQTHERDMLGERVERVVRLPRLARYLRRLGNECDPGSVAVDLGCGDRSPVPALLPHLDVVGVEGDKRAADQAAASGNHAEVLHADLSDPQGLAAKLEGLDVQLICLIHVIEHLPRHKGFELMRAIEAMTSRFVLIETPNRFQPQGPEYGNHAQRHLSGWFPHDFEALGYTVRGTSGTRYLRGYAGAPRFPFRGGQSLDFLLARLLVIERVPRHAYALTAFKDVRGVPARLG